MFTRYKGTEIPANYSGVRFRDYAPPPTEMKTHKPSPSYTSTKTSVSPAFRSMQLQRGNFDTSVNDAATKESAQELFPFENGFDGEASQENIAFEQDFYKNECHTCENSCQGCESCGARACECEKCTEKKAEKSDIFGEISEVLDKIFKRIQGEDFLILAIMLLIMGEGKSEAKGAWLPLALILLYS